jgi:hypothetical protein
MKGSPQTPPARNYRVVPQLLGSKRFLWFFPKNRGARHDLQLMVSAFFYVPEDFAQGNP